MLVQKVEATGGGLIISMSRDVEVSAYGKKESLPEFNNDQESCLFKETPFYNEGRYIQPVKVDSYIIGYLSIGLEEQKCTLLVKELISVYATTIAKELQLKEEKTSLRETSKKFLKKKKELEKVQEYNNNLLSMTTHDLSSPLNAVSGYLDLVEDCLENEAGSNKIKSYQQRIRSGIDDVSSMLKQLSEVTRFERAQKPLEYVDLNLCWAVEQVTDLMKNSAELKNISLSVHRSEMPVYVSADRVKLKRIINNLVSNAIKYTEEGGSIKVVVEARDDKAVLKVIDDGVGISDSKLATVFEPFVKLKEKDEEVISCGLGLHICSYFAEAMGGEISVKSKLDYGSTFLLELPAVKIFETETRQAG